MIVLFVIYVTYAYSKTSLIIVTIPNEVLIIQSVNSNNSLITSFSAPTQDI